MTSELKAATARANGVKKSRGPKTAETRAISSRNSVGHGFASPVKSSFWNVKMRPNMTQ